MKAPEDETMKWKRNAKDGVSPVIAVILMVAITVVLAGVVVLWVTRLSKTEEEGPEMLTLDVKLYSDGTMTIDNNGGGKITWTNYKITIDGVGIAGTSDYNNDNTNETWSDGTPGSTVETDVGERLTITLTTPSSITVGQEYTVKVVNLATQKVVAEYEVTAQAA